MSKSKIVGRSLLTICLLLMSGCFRSKIANEGDPAYQVAYRFRVPSGRVADLARVIGIDLDKINAFNNGNTFPVNYYIEKLEIPDETKRLRRSEVLMFVKGYTAVCRKDETNNHSLEFFFYSKELVQPATEVPLLMEIKFKQPVGKDDLDPKVGYISIVDLSEPDFNPPGSTAFLDCVKLRGHFETK